MRAKNIRPPSSKMTVTTPGGTSAVTSKDRFGSEQHPVAGRNSWTERLRSFVVDGTSMADADFDGPIR